MTQHIDQTGQAAVAQTLQAPQTPTQPQLRLVVGAGGGLGRAWLELLQAQDQAASRNTERKTHEVHEGHEGLGAAALSDAPPSHSVGWGRRTTPALDYTQPDTLDAAAAWLRAHTQATGADLRQVVVATGFLHSELGQPERSWRQLDAAYLQHVMQVNAIGPALLMRAVFDQLPKRGRVVVAFVSAKVGSIGDNALGGWYGYRASKAALNQFVKTAAIELRRHNKDAVCVVLHPGTVDTALSQPFAKTGLNVRSAQVAAAELQAVLDRLQPEQSGLFFDYKGQPLPW
jgi:NAD(P)-dependent dehydrogenase (short-subunit alcohol dehydrogenase family)